MSLRPAGIRPPRPAARVVLAASLFALLAATACDHDNAHVEPYQAWKDDLPIVRFTLTPSRLTVTVDDYVDLPARFRAIAEYNDRRAAEVKVDVWQKVSGIGSVVYDEFRAYGQTGECHIKAVHRNPYADKEAEVTVVVTGAETLPPTHIPSAAPELAFVKVHHAIQLVGAVNDPDAASDESPRRRVWLDPYYVAVNEVTRATFARFLNAWPHDVAPLCDPLAAGLSFAAGRYEVAFEASTFPMTHVSHAGALAFCAWLGANYRLPTEAEWEWAARGGSERAFPYGPTFSPTAAQVNRPGTIQVRSYPANGYGLFDVDGNVREWCSDWYGAAYYATDACVNPPGPAAGTWRVLRGGSYLKKYGVRLSERDKALPGDILPDVGLRPVYAPAP